MLWRLERLPMQKSTEVGHARRITLLQSENLNSWWDEWDKDERSSQLSQRKAQSQCHY